ncbi:ECF transporter S component [Bombilactobacillus bombi]|uniref:ECF transporter S component n=1 Tax=Bombilactobacillus bombi TaxID=1303590 RepID=UPI0015E6044D|nr:ECF transporter S component [Bombilactobacillus bombi]MBA1392591.1 ECF transporter S component [Lactobacillus sp. XV13L]MBA1433792.1 ECF transporter S component [Bombilactobacillus bombi]
MMKKNRAYKLAIRAVLIAIILVQSMTPFLGFIPLGLVNVTIIHLTVIVAAIVLGPGDGALVGLIWGIGTMIRAYTAPTSPLDTMVFTNPIIAVLPRILVGYLAGVVYRQTKNKLQAKTLRMALAAGIGSLTNTLVVLGLMRLLFASAMASAYKVTSGALNAVIMTIVATNGIPELIAAVIIVPMICLAIFRANKFLDN